MAGHGLRLQVVFIGVHPPSYLKDQGPVAPGGQLRPGAGAGLLNVVGRVFRRRVG